MSANFLNLLFIWENSIWRWSNGVLWLNFRTRAHIVVSQHGLSFIDRLWISLRIQNWNNLSKARWKITSSLHICATMWKTTDFEMHNAKIVTIPTHVELMMRANWITYGPSYHYVHFAFTSLKNAAQVIYLTKNQMTLAKVKMGS